MEYEGQSRYKYAFYRWIVDSICEEISKNGVIFDLGTGNGELALRLAHKFKKSKVCGVDISRGMVVEAKKKAKKLNLKNVRFIVSPMENLNKYSANFVVSNMAFHHVKNKKAVLEAIYSGLLPGGKVIIGDYFKADLVDKKIVKNLQSKQHKRTILFKNSWKTMLSDMTKEYREKHPPEYLVSPTKLEKLISLAGFKKHKVLYCPLEDFAIVIGVK